MNYFDENNVILGAFGKKIENPFMFSALLYCLDKSAMPENISFPYGINIKNFSHDESTSYLTIWPNASLPWRFIWGYMKNPFTWPRDLVFHLSCRFPKWFTWAMPILSLYMIWTASAHSKKTNFYKRWWIQLTQKYQHTVDLPGGGKRHFYTNNKVWDEHPESLEGKMLNIIRVKRLNMAKTARELDRISLEHWGPNYLYHFCLTYFENDINHPVVIASREKSYLTLAGLT